MKRINLFSVIMILISNIILLSCVTPMEFKKTSELRNSIQGNNINMEFIGFKGTYDTLGSDYETWQNFKKDTVLAKLGSILQSKNIAFDQSYAYFGIYSLQEIATYKSKQRYITFVEIEKNNFSYFYDSKVQRIFGNIGGGFIGAGIGIGVVGIAISDDEYVTDLATAYKRMGIGFSIAGAACLIPALIPAKTTISYNGIYSIYVYDTEKKEIIYKDTIQVGPMIDKYIGSYEHNDTNKSAVWNYYSTLAFNKIIVKYEEIYKFLEHRE
jgi:hypothetical protein